MRTNNFVGETLFGSCHRPAKRNPALVGACVSVVCFTCQVTSHSATVSPETLAASRTVAGTMGAWAHALFWNDMLVNRVL